MAPVLTHAHSPNTFVRCFKTRTEIVWDKHTHEYTSAAAIKVLSFHGQHGGSRKHQTPNKINAFGSRIGIAVATYSELRFSPARRSGTACAAPSQVINQTRLIKLLRVLLDWAKGAWQSSQTLPPALSKNAIRSGRQKSGNVKRPPPEGPLRTWSRCTRRA